MVSPTLPRWTAGFLAAGLMGVGGCAVEVSDAPEVLWSEEFVGEPGDFLDPAVWSPEVGDGTEKGIPGWGNGERQYYISDAAVLDGDGHLVIEATRMPVYSADNPDGMVTDANPYFCYYLSACEWTSARYVTENNVSFLYGRIEARMKMPEGLGTWPALWMLGTNIGEVGWPQSGEIDIIEGLGRDPMVAYGTIHGPGYSAGDGFGKGITLDDALSADFRTFAINWAPDYLSWEVDGVVYHEATPEDVAPHEWVFNNPHFLIVNLAMGGGFPGNVDPKLQNATLTVDYIRHMPYNGFGEVFVGADYR